MTTSLARVTFLEATGTVAGSRYLVEHDGRPILVDCRLFQGPKKLRQRNWKPPGFDVAPLGAVLPRCRRRHSCRCKERGATASQQPGSP